jgi:DNA-binding transcriptional ArsR family regulator
MEIIRLLLASEKPIHIKGIARSLKLDYAAAYRHIEDLREMGLVDIYEVGRSRVPYVKRKAEVAMLLDAANKLL